MRKILIIAAVGVGIYLIAKQARAPKLAAAPPTSGIQIPTGPAPVTSAGIPSAGGPAVVTV